LERPLRLPRVSDGDTFDVVVAGGGASGLIAGVAAARLGARSLLIEASGAFGGAATRNMVAQWLGFYNGEECAVRGLPLEFADRLVKRGGSIGFERPTSWWSRAVPRRFSTAAWFRSRSGQIASCRWGSRPKAGA
jgi:glycine/D-amino acid oxidase-like deaminating enzyme